MTRAFLLGAVLTAGFALPALAADTVTDNVFGAREARAHLLHIGYTNVSDLHKDAHGNWAGTAQKDGKTVPVAVGVRPVAPTTN